MAITTLDQLIAAQKQRVKYLKSSFTTVAGIAYSEWDVSGIPGAGNLNLGNTTTGVVPTAATAGAPLLLPFGVGNTGYLHSVNYGNSVASRIYLFDRLFHVGSISLTSLATTTLSSQPSFASRLPNTDYTDLELFLEVSAAVGATAVTVSVNYTDDLGNQGRASQSTGSLSSFASRRVVPIGLAAGDRGIQKIESVTVGGLAALSGSANIVVARRLWGNRVKIANDGGTDGPDMTGMPIVYQNSCLWVVVESDPTTAGTLEIYPTIMNG